MAKKPETEIEEFGADVEDIEVSGDIGAELTEGEKRKLEAEAKKEVAAALKASKMKDFKAAAKKRIQSETLFKVGKDDKGEDLQTVDLVLASYPKWIILDGTYYFSGKRYVKRAGIAAVLREQMARGWEQEEARRGEKAEWRDPRKKVLGHDGALRLN